MNIKFCFFLIIICSNISYSQIAVNPISKPEVVHNNGIQINPDIVLPKDSLESAALLIAVNSFLAAIQENRSNKWILPTQFAETQILIDEIQDIQKNKELDIDSFYKAYLTNIIPLEDDQYSVHISYMSKDENSVSLRASFELIAHKNNDEFLISSPLLRNTKDWKLIKINNHVFYYPFTIDIDKLQKIADKSVFYDDKLERNAGLTNYYLCKKEFNPLHLFGVSYKSDYNGDDIETSWSTQQDSKTIEVLNESILYGISMHDLWHHRLSQVVSRKEMNRRVDCNIACLYGGCWGISWDELFPLFNDKFVVGNNVDWLEHKKISSHFLTNGRKNYTDDFVGALIVKKIELSHGFDGVWELLKTKKTKGGEEYFEVLNKLIGMNKANYNREADKLIEEEKNRLAL